MSDEQRAGLALVLMVVILMLWSHFYKPVVPQKPPESNPPTATASAPAAKIAPPANETKKSNAGKKQTEKAAAKPVETPVKEASAEKTITIESPLYRVELSNRGGVVRSWKLNKYLNNDNPPKPLDLVNAAAAQQLNGWPLSIHLEDSKLEAEANSALYAVQSAKVVAATSGTANAPAESLSNLRAPVTVEFEWSDGHLDVTKKLDFDTSYQMHLSVSATLDGQPLPVGIAWRGGFGDQSARNAAAQTEVFYNENGGIKVLTYKKLGVKDHPEIPAQVSGYFDAAGIEDQFFEAAFLEDRPGITLWDWTQQHSIKEEGKTTQQPVAQMAAGPQAPGPWNTRLYVGPKDLTELGKLNPPLTGTVNYGFFSFLSKGLLWILKWSYKYVPNYGWDIVLLTIVINMLLFPLKAKGWRSMKQMQKVMPKQKAIQEKYKKYSMRDPRRRQMQEEMGALYKEHGVNPLGGCLPQLVQLPIWWELWRTLDLSIEMRHAPWLGWIHDLSAPDPYYILPILMAITMYYMTKMTPQTVTDPAQQKMMTLMPLAFALFFFWYSCGLVLYIFTSNLVNMGQQWYLNRADPLPSRSPYKNKPAKA